MATGAETDYLAEVEEAAVGPETFAQIVRSQSLRTVERRNRVLKLRRNGFTYDEISEAVTEGTDGGEPFELSVSGAQQIVAHYVAELRREDIETVETLRQIENERLERMFRRLETDLALISREAPDRDQRRQRIIGQQLRVMERHAKLNGLDAPTKMEGKVDVNVHAISDARHVRQVEDEWRKRLGQRKPSADMTLPAADVIEEPVDGEPD